MTVSVRWICVLKSLTSASTLDTCYRPVRCLVMPTRGFRKVMIHTRVDDYGHSSRKSSR